MSHSQLVRLRAIEPEDLDILYRIENDYELWEVGVNNVPYSRYMLHDYVAHAKGDIYTDLQVRLMIENLQHEVVGIVDMTNFDPQHRRAEIGITIIAEHRRKGYAKAAIHDICHYALSTLHLNQLYAIVAEDNIPSIHLFLKEGFEQQAILKNWLFNGKEYKNAVFLQFFL